MLEDLLKDGWTYHDSDTARLAGELEAAAGPDIPAQLLAPFVRLATHAIGEHLADWPRALALSRRVLDGRSPQHDGLPAWERLYVATVLAGDSVAALAVELTCLDAAEAPLERLYAMRFDLADALAGAGRVDEAGHIYRLALAAVAKIERSEPLDRGIAVASNNLGWTLNDLPSPTAEQAAVMALAADASLACWRRCGDWINEESAFYLKASVALRTGATTSAARLAADGLAVIAGNGKRPLDAARFHLLGARCFAASGDMTDRDAAVAAADREAAAIAFDTLRQQYAAERAELVSGWT